MKLALPNHPVLLVLIIKASEHSSNNSKSPVVSHLTTEASGRNKNHQSNNQLSNQIMAGLARKIKKLSRLTRRKRRNK